MSLLVMTTMTFFRLLTHEYVDVYVKGSDKKSPGNNVHYRLILIGIYYIYNTRTNVINIDFSFFEKDKPKGPR